MSHFAIRSNTEIAKQKRQDDTQNRDKLHGIIAADKLLQIIPIFMSVISNLPYDANEIIRELNISKFGFWIAAIFFIII